MNAGLVALVKSKSEITDVIGAGDVCRFDPLLVPQRKTTFPASTYRIINNTGSSTFDSASKLDDASVDIHCFGRTPEEASDLWDVMRKNLERQSGTYAGITIDTIFYVPSGQEDYNDETKLYSKLLELKVVYKRTP